MQGQYQAHINYIRSNAYKAKAITAVKASRFFTGLGFTNMIMLMFLGTIKSITGVVIKLAWAGTSLVVLMVVGVMVKALANHYRNLSQRVLYEN